jgi:hypothetical protein
MFDAPNGAAIDSAAPRATNIVLATASLSATSSAPNEGFVPPRWAETPAPPPVSWLVDGLFQLRTVNSLVGEPGVGKTRMAAHVAVSVAAGEFFLGRRTTPAAVLYLNFDDGEILPRQWTVRAARGLGCSTHDLPLYYWEPKNGVQKSRGLEDRQVLDDVRTWINGLLATAGEDEVLLVVDTFESAFLTKDSNSTNDVLEAYGILHGLIEDFKNLTVLVIDHTPKSKFPQNENLSASGSQQKKARVRTEHILSVENSGADSSDSITWKVSKMNAASKPTPFSVKRALDESIDADYLEAAEPRRFTGKPQQDSAYQFALAQLKQADGGVYLRELLEMTVSTLRISERTVKDALKELQQHPQVSTETLPDRGNPKILTWANEAIDTPTEGIESSGAASDATPVASNGLPQARCFTN